MNVSDTGLRLIMEFEGVVLRLYNDPVGHCTVGAGHLVHLGPCDGRASEAPFANGITQQQALDLLRTDVKSYADAVERYTVPQLNQNQFDAMTSLCYNIGQGGYRDSTVLFEINAGRFWNVCIELRKYVRGTDGIIYPGLVRRREAECQLFNAPYIPLPTPPEEEEEMQPYLVWDIDQRRIYLIGPWGASWITDSRDVPILEKRFGKLEEAYHHSTIASIGRFQ